MSNWIQSYSGLVVEPALLRPDQVRYEDIPHTLAQKVRFNGHLHKMGFSVAQHCVMGAEQIANKFKLAFLLHELSEVYLPDIPTPIKRKTWFDPSTDGKSVHPFIRWSELEGQHTRVILAALDLAHLYDLLDLPEVKLMDARMLMTEKRDLGGPEPKAWGVTAKPLKMRITRCWPAAEAKRKFHKMYLELTASR